jgi:hypothetical protein
MAINLDHVTEQITVTDTATDADLTLISKGTGAVNLNTGNGTAVRIADFSATTTAGLGIFAGSSAQNTVYVSPYGSGAGSNLLLASKGTGFLVLATNTSNNAFGTEQMRVTHTASAVNYVQATGAVTGGAPTISAQGSDTNIGLNLSTKGTGGFNFVSSGNSIFSGNGGTHFRIRTDIASASTFWEVFGSTGGPIFRSTGATAQIQTSGGALALQTDNAGTTQLNVSHTASAVNFVQVTGAATGGQPVISTQGSDANISLRLQAKGDSTVFAVTNSVVAFDAYAPAGSANWLRLRGNTTGIGGALEAFGSDANVDVILSAKGTGAVRSYTNGNQQFAVTNTASAVNYVQVTGATTGASPVLSAQGSDTNIDIRFTPKGTGNVRFGTHTGTADTAVSGYIEIKDSGGTIRKLAVIT